MRTVDMYATRMDWRGIGGDDAEGRRWNGEERMSVRPNEANMESSRWIVDTIVGTSCTLLDVRIMRRRRTYGNSTPVSSFDLKHLFHIHQIT